MKTLARHFGWVKSPFHNIPCYGPSKVFFSKPERGSRTFAKEYFVVIVEKGLKQYFFSFVPLVLI